MLLVPREQLERILLDYSHLDARKEQNRQITEDLVVDNLSSVCDGYFENYGLTDSPKCEEVHENDRLDSVIL